MDKKMFWKEVLPAKTRNQITGGATAAYISAALTTIAALLMNPFMFVDVALLIGLALGIHLGKSRICAIALLVYFLYSKFIQIASGGMTGGGIPMAIVFIMAFIGSIIGTFAYHKSKKEYLASLAKPLAPIVSSEQQAI